MLELDIPGRGQLALTHLVIDLNGTIAFDGEPDPDVVTILSLLAETLEVVVVTADTHGSAAALADVSGLQVHILTPGDEAGQKAELVRLSGASGVVAIGNGANDVAMLAEAAIGIAVIGAEGAAAAAVAAADVVTHDVRHALGLVAVPPRLVATLRS
jgi:P-type E1-E2 ATPase